MASKKSHSGKNLCFRRKINHLSIMRGAILLTLLTACCATGCHERPLFQDAGPLVTTTGGAVVGKYVKVFDTDVAAFLGVPFAEPPLAELRFRAPLPAQPWTGLKPAQQKPRPCPQYSPQLYAWNPTTESSEDCLYLNVWAPSRCTGSKERLPVMVWIHGGAYTVGSSDMDVYDGSVLASYGDVVVVSTNYRLGPFGFLSDGTEDAPGNAGLHDQMLALKWVKDNIANFGGDPEKVTIFGESAGAWSVSLHLVSPLSKGLFQRAIMQSGTMYHPMFTDSPEVAKQKGAEFAKLAGCGDEDVVRCLREKDAEELARLEHGLSRRSVIFFLPTYGESFLPYPPILAYESGAVPKEVDVLLGTVKDEGTVFLPFMAPEVFRFDAAPSLSPQQAESVTRALFQAIPKTAADAVVGYYFQNLNATEDGHPPDLSKLVAEALADSTFNCPTVFLAEKVGGHVYWLTHKSDRDPPGWMGVPHFSDVAYVFGGPIVDPTRFSPEDGKFSGDLIRMWADFARDGHPLKDDPDGWPAFSRAEPVARELNPRSPGLVTYPRFETCDRLWRQVYTPPQQPQQQPPQPQPVHQESVEVTF